MAGLHSAGWAPMYTAAAGVGVLVAVVVGIGLRNAPAGVTMVVPDGRRAALRASWREPATRLGLWTHFVTQFSGNTFALFCGFDAGAPAFAPGAIPSWSRGRGCRRRRPARC